MTGKSEAIGSVYDIARGHTGVAKLAPVLAEVYVHTGKADDRRSLSFLLFFFFYFSFVPLFFLSFLHPIFPVICYRMGQEEGG